MPIHNLSTLVKDSLLDGLVAHIKRNVLVLKDLVRHLFVLFSLIIGLLFLGRRLLRCN